MKIDISADVGESFGRWKLGYDEELMEYISSANVACGFHAGDPMVMRHTVKLAKKNGVKIGTHVGFPDLMGFGRRLMASARKNTLITHSIKEARCKPLPGLKGKNCNTSPGMEVQEPPSTATTKRLPARG